MKNYWLLDYQNSWVINYWLINRLIAAALVGRQGVFEGAGLSTVPSKVTNYFICLVIKKQYKYFLNE